MKASLDKIAKESAKEHELKANLKSSNTQNANEDLKVDRITELSPNKLESNLGLKDNLNYSAQSQNIPKSDINLNNNKNNIFKKLTKNSDSSENSFRM